MNKIVFFVRILPLAIGFLAMLFIAGLLTGTWPANQSQLKLMADIRSSELADSPRTKAAFFAADSGWYVSRNDYEKVACSAIGLRCL